MKKIPWGRGWEFIKNVGQLGELSKKIIQLTSFVLKREIWYVCTQTDLISESIPFSIRTSLILLMSADHASGV